MSEREWDKWYQEGDTPWDTGVPSLELQRVLEEGWVSPAGRALELGCGTGDNAIVLAQYEFAVTAVDLAPMALREAERRAKHNGVSILFLEADVGRLYQTHRLEPFDFIFDRGCYHCVRDENLFGFLKTLERFSAPGTRLLTLTGNANEQSEEGPPRLTEEEIRREVGSLFQIDWIREFRLRTRDEEKGPLAWSCLATLPPGLNDLSIAVEVW